MKYTCNKCKYEFSYKEDHQELILNGIQLFLCKFCIHRERLREKTSKGDAIV